MSRWATIGILALALGTTGCEDARNAHQAAMNQAKSCTLVVDLLGTPLDGSWSGFEMSSGSGSSKIDAHGSISGPKGTGAIHYEGIGDGKTWSIIRGWVMANGKTVDIVACKDGVASK